MIEKTYIFEVSTCYVGSKVKEEIPLYFKDDMTEEEIEENVREIYEDWMNDNIQCGWYEKK